MVRQGLAPTMGDLFWPVPLVLAALLLTVHSAPEVPGFPPGFPDFGRSQCKTIPHTMALCHGVGYSQMRLPNLLGHDSMKEVVQQAASWVPLLSKHCHADTRKFLCSLFAPVCLSEVREAIRPCRSLCRDVRDGCAPVMLAFGFPWPDMLDCGRFPTDNDLCIPSANSDEDRAHHEEVKVCEACVSEGELEKTILANYCKNDFVVKVKVKGVTYVDGDARVTLEGRGRPLLGPAVTELPDELWLAGAGAGAGIGGGIGGGCSCDELRDRSASFMLMGRLWSEGKWRLTLVRRWQGSKRDLRRIHRNVRKIRC
ncbi:secreted frizzled-related protein 2-like [Leucoraja erinacea]|uniref:secreted frizzled-related protein 2-like n=1 Tax=Leucoraja erinaceus TaxID=7782 RepID=UPI0024585272|nr:secreted frizzled-related protein 2-like [Leucoraja erinacea]